MENLLGRVGLQSRAVTSEPFDQLLSDIYIVKATQRENDEVRFSHEQENAIRHMPRFVVQRVQKKSDAHYVEMLIESDEATITDANSAARINMIDCGGLVHVTDACYQLFLAIEQLI